MGSYYLLVNTRILPTGIYHSFDAIILLSSQFQTNKQKKNSVAKKEEPKEAAAKKDEDVAMTDKTATSSNEAGAPAAVTTTTTTTTATTTTTTSSTTTSKEKKKIRKFYPETYIFIKLVVSLDFFDKKQFKSALQIVEQLIGFMKEQNRRTSDFLSARVYQLYSLCNQKLGRLPEIRQFLFTEYQTACLQQNEPAQSVLINLVLQNYMMDGMTSLARKFVEKAIFPESSDSQQFARFHYYRGRIDTVEVHYPQALFHIQQALRRAPQNGAIAFQLNATKWLIVVHLLMGDIPDRAVFTSLKRQQCQQQLEPYLKITEAVRTGDLKKFSHTLQNHDAIFKKDGLFMILQRYVFLLHRILLFECQPLLY
ncbi:proteasome regulatory component [Reticulomyxa filosa]|uniref:Proteasome regulatory component n=1 Tax=Reticulomyxa filosa TaxID=46433 RepID=X6P6N3_RETFI|nr:proteasome regulatory component [Reticulomyxa filosa]|eukprot:ETO33836.1 proteasome regulatory component [Reticulomyxa filosa]